MDKWGIVHCHVSLPDGKLLFWFNLVKHAREPHFWCNYSNPVPSQNIAELVFILFSCYIPFPDLKDNLYLLIPRLNYVHTNQSVPWPTATEESLSLIVERAFFPGPWAEVVPSWFGGKMKNTSIHPWNIRNMYPYVANVSRTHDFFKSDGILGYPIFKPKWQRTCILDPESPWSWKLRYQTAHKIDDFPIEPSGHLPLMSDFSRDSRPCPVWSNRSAEGPPDFSMHPWQFRHEWKPCWLMICRELCYPI